MCARGRFHALSDLQGVKTNMQTRKKDTSQQTQLLALRILMDDECLLTEHKDRDRVKTIVSGSINLQAWQNDLYKNAGAKPNEDPPGPGKRVWSSLRETQWLRPAIKEKVTDSQVAECILEHTKDVWSMPLLSVLVAQVFVNHRGSRAHIPQ